MKDISNGPVLPPIPPLVPRPGSTTAGENSIACGSHGMVEQTVTTKTLTLQIGGFLNKTEDIHELLATLYKENKNTTKIEMLISSYGGQLDELMQMVNILSLFKHRSAGILSTAQSAGALIWLSVPYEHRYLFPYSNIMIHNYSTWYVGKPNKIKDEFKHDARTCGVLIKNYTFQYLTKKERKAFEDGKEVYLNDMDILKRDMCPNIKVDGKMMKYKDYKSYIRDIEKKWK